MNGFFNFRKLVVGVMAATCFMGFQSCLDDDDDYPYSKVLPNALVTVKPVMVHIFFNWMIARPCCLSI